MNADRVYNALIERARNRQLSGYREVHHVVPRCLGGSDEPSNLVELTPEEHYVAHQLLVRLHPGNQKLIWAAIAMTESGRGRGRSNNKLYGWLKRRFSEGQKGRQYTEETKRKIGEKSRERNQGSAHPMFGRKHSPESRAKMRAAQLGRGKGCKRGPMTAEAKQKLREKALIRNAERGNAFAGQTHTEETRAKMRAAWARKKQAAQSGKQILSTSSR